MKDVEGFNWIGKTIYGVILYFIALGKTAWAVLKSIFDLAVAMGNAMDGVINIVFLLGQVFVSLGKVIGGIFVDAVRSVIDFGKNIRTVFDSIKQAIHGDFSGAASTIKGLFQSTFSSTVSAATTFGNDISNRASAVKNSFVAAGKSVANIGNDFKGVGTAWSDFAQLKGFDQAKMKFGALGSA